jgi:hypothetical protein
MLKPSDHSPDRDRKKWIYLVVSAIWLCLVLFVLISILFRDRSVESTAPQSPLSLLLALAAAGGLWALRWSSLASHLEDTLPNPSVVRLSNAKAESIVEPSINSPHSSHIARSIFGTDFRFKLTWLLQSIATLVLVLMIVTQWRPLILALLFAFLLVGTEILWLLCRLDQALLGAGQRSLQKNDSQATVDNQQNPIATKQQLQASDETVEQQEKLAVSYATTKEYEDLQSLRETLEHHRLSQVDDESSDVKESDEEPESQLDKPSRWQRDFRAQDGQGRVEGGVTCNFSKGTESQIISIGFVPPFASRPELLAECDAEDFFEVTILQSGPIGAKIEIRPLASNQEDRPSHVELVWEANSLS